MGTSAVKLGIIIQARMGSTRLPGKVLKHISDRPLLDHVVQRLSHLKHRAVVVVATSRSTKDDLIEDHCRKLNVNCFRGSELDVLERYYDCAKAYSFDQVVRLTADNPFTDIEELDRLIELHISGDYDFSASFDSLPVGVGAEIMRFSALELSHLKGDAPHHREHVDEYILDNLEHFHIAYLDVSEKKRRPDIRMTVDTEEDLRLACFIAEHTVGEFVHTEEAIELCSHFA